MPDRTYVIRVGEKNNFNFTEQELNDLQKWSGKGIIFVNSNSFVRISGKFPSIITINPYMSFVEPRGDTSNILACRIKWVCSPNEEIKRQQEEALVWCLENGHKVLITFFRFRSRSSLEKYTTESRFDSYLYDHSRFRPIESARLAASLHIQTITEQIVGTSDNPILYCDWAGKGCPSCGNCIRLATGQDVLEGYAIRSLNLSSSGDNGRCIFHCPDCWAHLILAQTCNKRPKCDTLFANHKQKGDVRHV